MFRSLIRILFSIAHTAGFTSDKNIDHELLRTDSAQDRR
jgi:hypothetical protein